MNTLEDKYKPLIEGMSRCSVVVKNKDNIIIQPPSLKSPSDWGWGIAEWNIFELGNGDVCGFYWKIGGEKKIL